jgi:membrane protein
MYNLLHSMRRLILIFWDAWLRFTEDDGWAIASHIALTILTSLFPFLIFVTALAGFFGTAGLADEAARLIFDAMPAGVAGPLATEVHNVLTHSHAGLLTVGAVLAIYFASSGIEAFRIGLNRAYDMRDPRPWYVLRAESILYVLVGAIGLLVLAVFIILAPLIWRILVRLVPDLQDIEPLFTFGRYAIAIVVLFADLMILHKLLAFGRRKFKEIWPGVFLTMGLWLVFGMAFGRYLTEFTRNYVSTYAGLASVMIAVVFLYTLAAIFIYGGELNAAMMRARAARGSGERAPKGITPTAADAAAAGAAAEASSTKAS